MSAIPYGGGSGLSVPESLLSDFRCFSWGVPASELAPSGNPNALGPRLYAIVPPGAASYPADVPADPSKYSVAFKLGARVEGGAGEGVAILLFDGNAGEISSSSEEWSFSDAGYRCAFSGASACLGAGAPDFLASLSGSIVADESSEASMPMEPALMFSMYRSSMVLSVGGQPAVGDVSISEGYGISAKISGGQALDLSAELGAGAGYPPAITPGSSSGVYAEECEGNILSINGIQPDQNGRFSIVGRGGIEVSEDFGEHKILLRVADLPGTKPCQVEDEGVFSVFFNEGDTESEVIFRIPKPREFYVEAIDGPIDVLDGPPAFGGGVSTLAAGQSYKLDLLSGEFCRGDIFVRVPANSRAFGYYSPCGYGQDEGGFETGASSSGAPLWILEYGYWNDEGIWIDSETWNDS